MIPTFIHPQTTIDAMKTGMTHRPRGFGQGIKIDDRTATSASFIGQIETGNPFFIGYQISSSIHQTIFGTEIIFYGYHRTIFSRARFSK